jgi:hypothetical protein
LLAFDEADLDLFYVESRAADAFLGDVQPYLGRVRRYRKYVEAFHRA